MSQFASSPSPTTPVTQRLKSERVQEALGATSSASLKSERVQEMLAAMPAWGLLPKGEAISRVFRLPSARVAAAFVEYVSTYAEAVGHNVHLEISGEATVGLTLNGPKVRGRYVELTEEIVAFAQQFG
jgi:pterin-4a-carbinolamine dehydratase